jgi:hypothetical protein
MPLLFFSEKRLRNGRHCAAGTVEMEAQCLIDMINQHVLPDCHKAGLPTAAIHSALAAVVSGLDGALGVVSIVRAVHLTAICLGHACFCHELVAGARARAFVAVSWRALCAAGPLARG